jgi:hypothetical protein
VDLFTKGERVRIIEAEWPHCDQFEKNIKDIQFSELAESDQRTQLDLWTHGLVKLYLTKLKWELGDLSIRSPGSKKDPSLIIKVYGIDGISYLNSYPETQQFMWVEDEDHHESIHPDKVLLMLLNHKQGVTGRVTVDEEGRSVMDLDINGNQLTIIDPRERGDKNE